MEKILNPCFDGDWRRWVVWMAYDSLAQAFSTWRDRHGDRTREEERAWEPVEEPNVIGLNTHDVVIPGTHHPGVIGAPGSEFYIRNGIRHLEWWFWTTKTWSKSPTKFLKVPSLGKETSSIPCLEPETRRRMCQISDWQPRLCYWSCVILPSEHASDCARWRINVTNITPQERKLKLQEGRTCRLASESKQTWARSMAKHKKKVRTWICIQLSGEVYVTDSGSAEMQSMIKLKKRKTYLYTDHY